MFPEKKNTIKLIQSSPPSESKINIIFESGTFKRSYYIVIRCTGELVLTGKNKEKCYPQSVTQYKSKPSSLL